MRILQDVDLEFVATSQREARDALKFDRALKEAQNAEKPDQFSANINLAASIALGLTTTSGIKHVVTKVVGISKDSKVRKEAAVYLVDSLMRHAQSSAHALLAKRYERHLAPHVPNIFKRALRSGDTRKDMAEKFLRKILPKWRSREWFKAELLSVEESIYKVAPSLRPKPPDELQAEESQPPEASQDADSGGGNAMSIATAKAGAPGTPAQPAFLLPTTPRGFAGQAGQVRAPAKMGSEDVLNSIPSTPKSSIFMTVPSTPTGTAIPMTPKFATAMIPRTPTAAPLARVPSKASGTPGAEQSGMPGLPGTPGAAAVPRTPALPPTMAAAPFTPFSAPYTPRAPAPFTPGVVAPYTPRAPGTPRVVPFSPGFAQRPGFIAPATPGGAPGTPGVQFMPAPATPGMLAPMTPARPVPGTPSRPAPGTPGWMPVAGGEVMPMTPRPFTLAGVTAPGTPTPGPAVPGVAPAIDAAKEPAAAGGSMPEASAVIKGASGPTADRAVEVPVPDAKRQRVDSPADVVPSVAVAA